MLGDAVHPTLPYPAQGAAMAIGDACTLARCVTGSATVPAALQRYERNRDERTARIVRESAASGRLFQMTDAEEMRRTFAAGDIGRARSESLNCYDPLTVPLPWPFTRAAGDPAMTQMLRVMAPAALLILASGWSSVHAADDIRTGKLEQDVLELQRQARQQDRRIEALERELATVPRGSGSVPAGARAANSSLPGTWMQIANWDRLKPGMPELDVVQALGPPTSLRNAEDGSRKTLYYAMEIGTGSFLIGTVVIAGQRIVEIQKPTFR